MDIVKTILINFAFQLISTIGIIALFGVVVGFLNVAFYKLVGYRIGRIVCLATGFIGVPVHEIGHALFCIIFRHKIIEMKLYQPDSTDGTLGYVYHSYDRRNIYHQIGNFFIGFGPILFGSAVLMLLMYWLVPNLFEAFKNSAAFSEIINPDVFSFSAIKHIFDVMRGAAVTFYSFSEAGNWRWWLFMIPACSIALHMSLSLPDIKSSLAGFGFIVVTLLITNTILYFAKISAMLTLTSYCFIAGSFILNFLTISIVFSIILFLIGVVVRLIPKLRVR